MVKTVENRFEGGEWVRFDDEECEGIKKYKQLTDQDAMIYNRARNILSVPQKVDESEVRNYYKIQIKEQKEIIFSHRNLLLYYETLLDKLNKKSE